MTLTPLQVALIRRNNQANNPVASADAQYLGMLLQNNPFLANAMGTMTNVMKFRAPTIDEVDNFSVTIAQAVGAPLTPSDVLAVRQAFQLYYSPGNPFRQQIDTNKNGKFDTADVGRILKNFAFA